MHTQLSPLSSNVGKISSFGPIAAIFPSSMTIIRSAIWIILSWCEIRIRLSSFFLMDFFKLLDQHRKAPKIDSCSASSNTINYMRLPVPWQFQDASSPAGQGSVNFSVDIFSGTKSDRAQHPAALRLCQSRPAARDRSLLTVIPLNLGGC